MDFSIENLKGQKYNRLTIIDETDRYIEPNGKKQRVMVCKCDCGNISNKRLRDLRLGKIKSCGCLNQEHPIDISKHNKYGLLTIIKEIEPYISPNNIRLRRVSCSCTCGGNINTELTRLRTGKITNCGCIKKVKELKPISKLNIKELNKKNFGEWTILSENYSKRDDKNEIIRNIKAQCSCGFIKDTDLRQFKKGGKSCFECAMKLAFPVPDENELNRRKIRNNLQSRYFAIKSRCLNPNDKFYHRYGGRGITICKEWKEDFEKFYIWCLENGYSKELQIDRINNDGNYEPSNCRWITHIENVRNKSPQ